MSYAEPTFTRVSAADLSGKEYLIAKIDANGKADIATAGTDDIIGVITEGGKASGDPVTIQDLTDVSVTMSASCNEGDWITATTGGKGVATTTDGDVVLGWAMEAAGADGDRIKVRMHVHRIYVP